MMDEETEVFEAEKMELQEVLWAEMGSADEEMEMVARENLELQGLAQEETGFVTWVLGADGQSRRNVPVVVALEMPRLALERLRDNCLFGDECYGVAARSSPSISLATEEECPQVKDAMLSAHGVSVAAAASVLVPVAWRIDHGRSLAQTCNGFFPLLKLSYFFPNLILFVMLLVLSLFSVV
jgi:hypothetical protein